jgi:poly(3-hydroxyalkanoate) depolymerase
MQPHFTEIRGLKVRYAVVVGEDEDKAFPLLICGGIGQSMESLTRLSKALTCRDVILFDAPGAGESEAPLKPLSMAGYGHVVMELLDFLGYDEVDVMGISWGGTLAQQLANAQPGRCRRLVLAITAPGGLTLMPGKPGLIFEMTVPTRYLSARRRKKMLPKLAGGDALDDPASISDVYESNRRPSLWGYYSQALVVRFWTSLHFLHKLKQPTLVISGSKDPLVPPINQKILACGIPNSEFKSYDCGHYLHVTRHDRLVMDIQQFLD